LEHDVNVAVLWNRYYFLRFRFRFHKAKSYGSYGSGSGSGSTTLKCGLKTNKQKNYF